MRKKIVAGNWKMNKTLQEGVALAQTVEQMASALSGGAQVVVAPPFLHLTEVKKVLKTVSIAAQNCAAESSGAYTGEVSAAMLKSAGIEYVILGHSERRAYYGETDAILAKKVDLALANGLTPIFCCGEVLSEREQNLHLGVVKTQLADALFHLSAEQFSRIVIAYEPVWAIGTGVTATSDQAQEMHHYIRGVLAEKYGAAVANEISILYGGSCKPSNAGELFANPDVDGGLIGGASLEAGDFIGIVKAF
ncbi:triose-phosphate isomerase [Methylotetracoccus oryzae]|uniref:triose-phosphate isomerase n=1 Tax=Methylotetracoccus oryzae TaxID=1919059 RepID=UPI001118131C|nr:triose-phosphate isomerase [Methylotetracoccus oryzae]